MRLVQESALGGEMEPNSETPKIEIPDLVVRTTQLLLLHVTRLKLLCF